MLIPDVDVLLGAHRADDPHHETMHSWLAGHLAGGEAIGVSELVLSAVVRTATNPRIYDEPATPQQALDFCDAVRGGAAAVRLVPGPRHWEIFTRLVRETSASGNAVPDAYLAAFAIEASATFVSRDRGLSRFRGLALRDPLAA